MEVLASARHTEDGNGLESRDLFLAVVVLSSHQLGCEKFSNVSALVSFLHKISNELTFENVHRH
jgi:hypothetical protein